MGLWRKDRAKRLLGDHWREHFSENSALTCAPLLLHCKSLCTYLLINYGLSNEKG